MNGTIWTGEILVGRGTLQEFTGQLQEEGKKIGKSKQENEMATDSGTLAWKIP